MIWLFKWLNVSGQKILYLLQNDLACQNIAELVSNIKCGNFIIVISKIKSFNRLQSTIDIQLSSWPWKPNVIHTSKNQVGTSNESLFFCFLQHFQFCLHFSYRVYHRLGQVYVSLVSDLSKKNVVHIWSKETPN